MQLALDLLDFGSVSKVPVPAGITVPAPVRDGGHVGDDAVHGLRGSRL